MNDRLREPEKPLTLFWFYARVKNRTGVHVVFYATTRPRIGSECPGIAKPNRVIGYRRERITL